MNCLNITVIRLLGVALMATQASTVLSNFITGSTIIANNEDSADPGMDARDGIYI